MRWLRDWEWSVLLAILLSTGIAVWLAIYPELPDEVKSPFVDDITAIAGKVTQVAANAGGGLIPYLFLLIQLVRTEVKDVIFSRNLEKKAAVLLEREAAVKQREAAVIERAAAAAEQEAAVAQRAAAAAEQEAAVAQRAAAAAEQEAAVAQREEAVKQREAAALKWAEEQGFNLPPGIAPNGPNGKGDE